MIDSKSSNKYPPPLHIPQPTTTTKNDKKQLSLTKQYSFLFPFQQDTYHSLLQTCYFFKKKGSKLEEQTTSLLFLSLPFFGSFLLLFLFFYVVWLITNERDVFFSLQLSIWVIFHCCNGIYVQRKV